MTVNVKLRRERTVCIMVVMLDNNHPFIPLITLPHYPGYQSVPATTDSTNKLTNSSLIVLPQPHNLIYNRMVDVPIRSPSQQRHNVSDMLCP